MGERSVVISHENRKADQFFCVVPNEKLIFSFAPSRWLSINTHFSHRPKENNEDLPWRFDGGDGRRKQRIYEVADVIAPSGARQKFGKCCSMRQVNFEMPQIPR